MVHYGKPERSREKVAERLTAGRPSRVSWLSPTTSNRQDHVKGASRSGPLRASLISVPRLFSSRNRHNAFELPYWLFNAERGARRCLGGVKKVNQRAATPREMETFFMFLAHHRPRHCEICQDQEQAQRNGKLPPRELQTFELSTRYHFS